MHTGRVKWFSDSKGYGFIGVDGSEKDVFVHYTDIDMNGFKSLTVGQVVQFEIVEGPRGPHATKVSVLRSG